ncbi:MAG: dockerin type I repeat-containing protein [Ruminococcus sp.]|uniref:dockerin type I repeat-containing protein n=1 Tax=Ruminococcus sp. TaxID=41978 RepID=UPI001B23F74D|nr:dockerin type I repeat-containing protein [Ruminococcus sp.]MBO7472556.1 dockerin type I repeat-containing protein [Ruminococcus sp.]
MKKSIFTVMTAAMFAAANMSALPADCSENEGINRPKVDPVESLTLTDSDWNKEKDDDGENLGTVTSANMTYLTTTSTQTLYGAPWVPGTTTFTTSDYHEMTATTTQTLYGPPWVFGSTTTTVSDPDEDIDSRMKGDVNGDLIVDTFDAIALRRAILFDEYKDKRAKLLSDINSDGKVDVSDLVLLQRFLLGAIKDFSEYDSGSILSEKTTLKEKDDTTTTTTFTTAYDPRGDVVISLYGVKPSIERTKEAIDEALEEIEEAGAILEELEREEEED